MNLETVACKNNHTVVLTSNGDLYGWGYNACGQLGVGNTTNQTSPVKIPIAGVVSFACGNNHTVVLTSNGDLYGWGHNSNGELGVGNTTNQTSPVKIPIAGVVSFTCGNHTVVLTSNGDLYGWGYNSYGQLGVGNTTNQTSPVKIPIAGVVSFACGNNHTVVLTSNGDLYGLGYNSNGELGVGNTTNQTSPVKIPVAGVKLPASSSLVIVHQINDITLQHLLTEPKYQNISDFECCGIKMHKPIISVRCLPLLTADTSACSFGVIQLLSNFLYSNILDTDSVEDLCALLSLSKLIEFGELTTSCQYLLLNLLSEVNAFDALCSCLDCNLEEEINWVCWYIGKSKLTATPEIGLKLMMKNPIVFTTAMQQVANLTLPPPPSITVELTAMSDIMETLFTSGSAHYSDFELKVCSETLYLHTCILSTWDFYHSVLKHDGHHESDLPCQVFKKLIRYVYSGKVDGIEMVDAGWMLSLLGFYLLEDKEGIVRVGESDFSLCAHCEGLVNGSITSANWIPAYLLGAQLNNETLKAKAIGASSVTVPLIVSELIDDLVGEVNGLKTENKGLKVEVRQLKQTIQDLTS